MLDFPSFLLNGYKNFMSDSFVSERERYKSLAEEGQNPTTMMIACCDSRAAPETIFNARPGQLFVMRNVANLVPPYRPDGKFHATSSSLEYAVTYLEVENIVVMGHGRCGGIQSALSTAAGNVPTGDFIGPWLTMLASQADDVNSHDLLTQSERQTALERISIRQSILNLSSFPFIKKRLEEGSIKLHGAWFDISTGELWVMDNETGDFLRPDLA